MASAKSDISGQFQRQTLGTRTRSNRLSSESNKGSVHPMQGASPSAKYIALVMAWPACSTRLGRQHRRRGLLVRLVAWSAIFGEGSDEGRLRTPHGARAVSVVPTVADVLVGHTRFSVFGARWSN
jgi:hypothetical protein